MGLLDDGRALLRANRALVAGTIKYSRGATSASIPGVQGETEFEADTGETIIKAHYVDWIIERADLRMDFGAGEVEVTPQTGDKITKIYTHGGEVFQVAAPPGLDAWEWHGRDGATYRIHTVRVSE